MAPLIWEFDGNFGEVDLKDENGNVLRDWRKILTDLVYYQNNSTRYSKEALANGCIMKIKLETC